MMSPDMAIFGGSLEKKIWANKHPSERVWSACPLDLFLLLGLLYLPMHTHTLTQKSCKSLNLFSKLEKQCISGSDQEAEFQPKLGRSMQISIGPSGG